MLPDIVNFNDDYAFKSSPESCSDNSFCTDIMDVTAEEDFITQLSSELDIPLLLGQGEDDMAVLNSFFDKSPDEILSDITSPAHDESICGDSIDIKDLDFLNWGLDPPCNNNQLDYKSEEHSDTSSSSSNSLEPSTPPAIIANKKFNPSIYFTNTTVSKKDVISFQDLTTVQVVPQSNAPNKVPIKRVPIKPKSPYAVPVKNSNNIVVIKNEFPNVISNGSNVINANNLSSKVVVLDRVPTLPVSGFKGVTPHITSTLTPIKQNVTVPSILVNSNCNVDPKIFKRQQRKIKNRESACLSRKKKKDYLNSLEDKLKDLTVENKRLLEENIYLKERLSHYENDNTPYSHISSKGAKPALVLCVFLLVVGLNFNFIRSPFQIKKNTVDITTMDYPKLPDHHARGLLWADEDNQNKNNTYFSPLTMCPASINQTESARLLLELEKWIGKPEPTEKAPVPIKKTTQKPKIRRKKVRIDSSLVDLRNKAHYGPENEFKNEIQVFSPKPEQLYSDFFEAINRKDDTFYVVSFSEQHMLLPALYHNKTARPKMSLLMPSVLLNETSSQTYVPLMQIDCEVLDTKLVNVKYGSIPRQYRHYGNVTKPNGNGTRKNRSDNSTSSNNNKKPYKPYFLSKNFLKVDEYN